MEENYIVDYDSAKEILDEIINSLKKIETFNLQKKFLKEIQSDILETNNLELFYKMCTEGNLPFAIDLIEPYIETVLKSKSAKYNYKFAMCVPGVDISKHAKVVIESKDAEYNYLFAKDVKGADKKAHAKAVIESKNPEYNYLFAKNIRDSNKKAHAKVVIQSKDPEYNYSFVCNVSEADKVAHAKAVIESKDLKYNYLFLEKADTKRLFFKHSKVILESKDSQYNHIVLNYIRQKLRLNDEWKRKDIKLFVQKLATKHLRVLFENNDISSIYAFISDMNDSELQEYSRKLLESKELYYNYYFAKRKGINILEHAQVILDSRDLEYNYLFASNVSGADVLAHGKVIIESKNLEYNYKFAKYVKGADIDAHRLVILEAEKRSRVDEEEQQIINRFLMEFPGTDYSAEVMNVKSLIKKYNNN